MHGCTGWSAPERRPRPAAAQSDGSIGITPAGVRHVRYHVARPQSPDGRRLPAAYGQRTRAPSPDPLFSEVLDSIRAIAARTPKGTWIKTAIGLHVLDDTAARRTALERVTADHPVFLWTWWGHGAVLNSAALHALGVAEDAHDPLGGWYERDAAGRLTGRLDEYAEWGALRRL